MKKKLLALALCFSVSFGLIACGGAKTASTESTDNSEELFASIREELNTSEKLESNYFSSFYDLKDFDSAKDAANTALDNSDKESYESVLSTLKEQNEALKEFIDKKTDEVYNAATADSPTDEYPFAMKDDLGENFVFVPAYKVSSKDPTTIEGYEAKTTDGEPYACIFTEGGSFDYSYEIKQIDTTEIDVNADEAGTIEKALVNTQINFTANHPEFDDMAEINSRSMYLVRLKDGNISLLVPSYSGEDYYISYIPF